MNCGIIAVVMGIILSILDRDASVLLAKLLERQRVCGIYDRSKFEQNVRNWLQ